MAQVKGIAFATACFALCPISAIPETRHCAGTHVVVSAETPHHAALACEAATKATALFADCAIPAQTDEIVVRIVNDMQAGCFGLFHCEMRLVEVLSPDALHDVRAPESIFAHITTEAYFQSIVVHELAHAATEKMPCPFDGCFVGPEYIAYLMQMKSLDPAELEEIEQAIDMDAPVSFDGFHPFILMLAPDIFSQTVWAHHRQQDDPCGFVDALMRGDVFLDIEILEPE